MTLLLVSPTHAARLIAGGAVPLDVRPAHERTCDRLPGARCMSDLGSHDLVALQGAVVVLYGQGSEARDAWEVDPDEMPVRTYGLAGGIEAWQAAGLPVADSRALPPQALRRVQAALALIGLVAVILARFVAPAFYGLASLTGVVFLSPAVTGDCMITRLLLRLSPTRRLLLS